MTRTSLAILVLLMMVACTENKHSIQDKSYHFDKMTASMDHFHTMRSFPNESYDQGIIFKAAELERSKQIPKTFTGSWAQQGPTNIGGRINSLAISPDDAETMLIGLSYGGIYGTTNGGITWTSIFEGQVDQSISEIVYDPNNSNNIWVGTGDKSVPFTAFMGSGIYHSTDSGNSWENKGLAEMGIIGKIIVDPNDSNNIYAAALGKPVLRDNNRGLYKSTDGGNTWSQSLFVNDSTGILDVHMSPTNSNILYANSWTRIRTNKESTITGTENKIFKSTDGGNSWTQLSNGLPSGVFSKVSITVAPQNPDRLYASYLNIAFDLHAIYTSDDGGDSWTEYFTEVPYYNFGWYFDQLVVDPNDENDLYILNVNLHRINNGTGISTYESNYHSDCHELIVLGQNQALLATDGGLFKSSSFAASDGSWIKIDAVPATQYYRVVHKPSDPTIYVGGSQDNSMSEGSIANPASWLRFGFGDGFQPRYLETRDEYFSESQFGNIQFYANDETTSTGNFGSLVSETTNWDTPYIVDEDLIMHIGAQSVYRADWNEATNEAGFSAEFVNFEKISPALTDPAEPYHSSAHVITTIDKSGNSILAGTGDGRLWISNDNGLNWNRLDENGLPERYIKAARISKVDPSVLFVCHSGYKDNDNTPHIYFSPNSGQNWLAISGDLPNVGINDLELIPGTNDQSIVIGTDIGVYGTINQGLTWSRVGDNLSYTPVFDVHYNHQEEEIAAGTFGNSILTFPAEDFLNPIFGVGIEEDVLRWQLGPNPSDGQLWIEVEKAAEVKLFSLSGQLVYQKSIDAGREHFNLDHLSSGMYTILATQDGKMLANEKWIKR